MYGISYRSNKIQYNFVILLPENENLMFIKLLSLTSVFIFLFCAEISSSEAYPFHRPLKKTFCITNTPLVKSMGKTLQQSLFHQSLCANFVHKFSGGENPGKFSDKIIVVSGPCNSSGFMYEHEKFPDIYGI